MHDLSILNAVERIFSSLDSLDPPLVIIQYRTGSKKYFKKRDRGRGRVELQANLRDVSS
jgi:hypothetical protein